MFFALMAIDGKEKSHRLRDFISFELEVNPDI
jgi:hypothetical protein